MNNKYFNYVIIVALAVTSIFGAVHYKNTEYSISYVGANLGRRVNVVGYMSPIMKEDFSFFYLCDTPYDYELEDKTIGVYSDKNFGYSEYLTVVNGIIDIATKDNYDVIKIYEGDEVGYLTKEELTSEKLDIIESEHLDYEYMFTDGSGNTFKYRMNAMGIKPYTGSEYKVQNDILKDGYVSIVNGLLSDVADTLDIEEISEADIERGYTHDELASESNLEHNISEDTALALLDRLNKLDGYNEIKEVVKDTISVHSRLANFGVMTQEDKEICNRDAKVLYRRFIESLKSLKI